MLTRLLPFGDKSLIAALALVPALAACGTGGANETAAPLSAEAMKAVDRNAGAPRSALAREIDALFADEAVGKTRAVLILRQGRIVAERYGDGFSKQTRHIGWSMTKTVTGIMIGQLVSDGRLRMDETAPVPAWQRSGDPRGEITLRQLLQMRSGLRHTEGGDPVYRSDEVRMLFLDGRDDMAAYAEAQPLEHEPGRRFDYSSATSVILADLAARVLTDQTDPEARRTAVSDYLRTRFLDPAGMGRMVAGFDAAGTFVGSSTLYGTARDWGRLGEFLRNGGSVKGAQLVPRGWIEFMRRPSPRNPAYGAQLWLNRPSSTGEDPLFPGKAGKDVFAAIGHMGQYVIVSPRQKVTLVRLGHTPDEKRPALRARLARILALFPEVR